MVPLKSNLNVVLERRGLVTIRESDHLATGGGGRVYRLGDTAIKILHDPHDLNVDVISIMAGLSHPHILLPKLVFDERGQNPIGVWMRFSHGEPLSRVFTNDWRSRVGFEDKHAHILVDRIFGVADFAHNNYFWLVDFNELGMNVIFNRMREGDTAPEVYDVDSWVYKGCVPATVRVMPSIQDPHNRVGMEADIFAIAIIAFQVYTGIHPYKGGLDGYKPKDMQRRMEEKKSVFEKGIRLNTAVRDFNCISPRLLEWFEGVFQYGERSVPPSPFEKGGVSKTARAQRVIVTATGTLIYEKLFADSLDNAIRVYRCGVVLLRSGKMIDLSTKKQIATVNSHEAEVAEMQTGWLISDKGVNGFEFKYIDRTRLQEQQLPLTLKGYGVVTYESRMFLVTDQGLTELTLRVFSARAILTPGQNWGVMVNSTRWFDGVGVMDAMGAMFLIAPFGTNAVAQVRVKELDGLRIVNAKAGNRFVVLITVDKNGDYKKIELTFDKEYKTYQVWQAQSDTAELNMALLPKGVGATIVRDGELVIFVPTNGTVNKVSDKDVTTTMILGNWGDRVVYTRDGAVWSIRMK